MAISKIDGDLIVSGSMAATTLVLPSASVSNTQIAASPAIDDAKMYHRHHTGTNFGLGITGTVATSEFIVYVAQRSASIQSFKCTCNVGGTVGDSDFDLKVNGSTVLSAAVNFDNADTDASTKTGTISAASLSTGDVVSIAVTRNSSHDGTGPFAWAEIKEDGA